MGITYRTYLEGSNIFGCAKCKTHLTTEDDILSTDFRGHHGQAFLFDKVVNINYGVAVDREMTTGLHRVKDITCVQCSMLLGWTYVKAYNEGNKYKEGKFILEKKLLLDITPRLLEEWR